jgi:hypothetical protein
MCSRLDGISWTQSTHGMDKLTPRGLGRIVLGESWDFTQIRAR